MQDLARYGSAICLIATFAAGAASPAAAICEGYGPQTPRDITQTDGSHPGVYTLAPPASQMNLCNIHSHTQAEHKGPGFSVFAGEGEHDGYRCNETDSLTEAELADPTNGEGTYEKVKPGDTIEVHWVYTTCDVEPGEGLGACLSDACQNPQLRVETHVFLVVNDPNALNFNDFDYDGHVVQGFHQAKAHPSETGQEVVFVGSTTGESFTHEACSPLQVTWAVHPECVKLDVSSLHAWAEKGEPFRETQSHGIRPLVTQPELLSPIN